MVVCSTYTGAVGVSEWPEYCPVTLDLRVPHKAHEDDDGEESPQLIDVKLDQRRTLE